MGRKCSNKFCSYCDNAPSLYANLFGWAGRCKKPSSVVYDAERLVQWLAKYDIKLLLHGHKHQSFVSKIGHFDNSIYEIDGDRMKNIYVIGMGGTGAFNCENKFSTLTFCNDHIELKFFRIYADNTETDKCVQTLRIPI